MSLSYQMHVACKYSTIIQQPLREYTARTPAATRVFAEAISQVDGLPRERLGVWAKNLKPKRKEFRSKCTTEGRIDFTTCPERLRPLFNLPAYCTSILLMKMKSSLLAHQVCCKNEPLLQNDDTWGTHYIIYDTWHTWLTTVQSSENELLYQGAVESHQLHLHRCKTLLHILRSDSGSVLLIKMQLGEPPKTIKKTYFRGSRCIHRIRAKGSVGSQV